MSGAYAFIIEGLDDIAFEKEKGRLIDYARMSLNDAADFARVESKDRMTDAINFPASYFQGGSNRLQVTQRASNSKLEAVITGRQRPTSLARFVTGNIRNGVRVSVKRGSSTPIENAFLMPLKSGKEPGGNMGLAVRVKRGQTPRGAFKPTRINDRLWLLYGPSVDQVFKSVREEVAPNVERRLQQEFYRLWEPGI